MNKAILLITSLLLLLGCENETVFKRSVYLKLPLKQPKYHWIFSDRASFVEHVTLKLDIFESQKMKVKEYTFSIIENGKISSEWTPLDDDNNKEDNSLYFGFSSNKQFDFSTSNYAKLTLKTSVTLKGVGSENTGNLPSGSYTSFGQFIIYDEDKYDAGPDENAFLDKESLSPYWELVMTSDEGYVTVAEAEKNEVKKLNKSDKGEENKEKLIAVFIPSLSEILTAAENSKGSALTEEEVLNLRDNSQTIMLPKSMVNTLAESRGYKDIDPENCWNEWLLFRSKQGKEVDENGGAIVLDSPKNNDSMRQAEKQARESLDQFRTLIEQHPTINPLIKVKLVEPNTSARMWLIVDKATDKEFKAHLFEVPSDFVKYKAGDSFTISSNDVLDWMLNVDGDVYGAYTIREQRKSMTPEKRKEMDEYMGINHYK